MTTSDGHFRTTRWSVVLAAGRADSPSARDALETLCRSYWFPLYGYARRHAADRDAAHDLVQGFFARLLEKRDLADADRERGRFRAFLLTALKNYMANERDRAGAAKRGGGRVVLSLDVESAEGRLSIEEDAAAPDAQFDRHWALVVMERVLESVREEYVRANRGELFERLTPCLTGDGDVPYRDLAQELEMTEAAFKVAVHRARKRFRECLRREVAETLSDPGEIEAELRDLVAALASG